MGQIHNLCFTFVNIARLIFIYLKNVNVLSWELLAYWLKGIMAMFKVQAD